MRQRETAPKTTKKFAEIVNYVCHTYNHGDLTEMKLWKLLFFCEADFYEKYGKRLTDIDYIKNTHGPTPEYPLPNGHPAFICPNELTLQTLSAQELESIQETCEKYSRLPASALRSLSHDDPIFLAAEHEKDILDFSLVRYRVTDDAEDMPRTIKRNVVRVSPATASKLAALVS